LAFDGDSGDVLVPVGMMLVWLIMPVALSVRTRWALAAPAAAVDW
jgi:hypothetical protein